MSELKLKIPADVRKFSRLEEKELSDIALQAIKEALWKDLLLKTLDKLLEKSEMTDELALKLGDELKERVAKRHGVL
jgi:hypothetical protein